jgi:hypothetical protein
VSGRGNMIIVLDCDFMLISPRAIYSPSRSTWLSEKPVSGLFGAGKHNRQSYELQSLLKTFQTKVAAPFHRIRTMVHHTTNCSLFEISQSSVFKMKLKTPRFGDRIGSCPQLAPTGKATRNIRRSNYLIHSFS